MYKKIWTLLSSKEKNKSLFFLFLTLINTVVEISIVLMIVPLTQILLQQDINLPFFGEIDIFGIYSYSDLVLGSVLLLLLAFLIKNLFTAYYQFWQFKFAGDIEKRLSRKLFENYLYRPYLDHLDANTGVLGNNVLNEITHVPSYVRHIFTLISEVIILILIGSILIVYEPQGSITVILISLLFLFILNFFQKKYMIKFGENRYIYHGNSNKHLVQGLNNVKDIKLLGKENFFLNKYFDNFSKSIKYRVFYEVLSTIPKPISEIILAIAFVGLVLVLIITGNLSSIVTTTSLFLIATYRLLPSIIRITNAFQSLKVRQAVISALVGDLLININKTEKNKLAGDAEFNFENKIDLNNIEFSYPSSKIILKDISFEINKGEMIGFVGASGSGKTTLIDLILGLLNSEKGSIIVDKIKITEENLKNWQNMIGYVPQNPTFIDDTIKKNIAFGIDENDIDNHLLESSIKQSNLENFIKNQSDGLDTFIGEKASKISGGQKQRIAIARALYKNPQIVIFDEATSSLDEVNEKEIIQNISLLKGLKTSIVIAHKLSILKNCDRIITVKNGSVI